MAARAIRTHLTGIQYLRALYLQEMNAQIRYDAYHARGWTDSYLLYLDDLCAGYGSVKGQQQPDRDTIFEFYVIPPLRRWSRLLFSELIAAARVTHVECQINDRLLAAMLYEFAEGIQSDTVLFEEHVTTHYEIARAVVRARRDDDRIFEHAVEPVGEYVLETDGRIVATAGFMLHYNPPFADLYMEVRADERRRGFGSFILQEVKKACYLAGRIPAARTGLGNIASRATLQRAGLRISGFMLTGTVKPTGQA
jgi:GNAT superfamily N-acetyltransferase